jgi:hypothetical protein
MGVVSDVARAQSGRRWAASQMWRWTTGSWATACGTRTGRFSITTGPLAALFDTGTTPYHGQAAALVIRSYINQGG